jgi:DNA-binding response OmpR family regulator
MKTIARQDSVPAAIEPPLRVLIVEDDAAFGQALQEYLSREYMEVLIEPRGDRAVQRIAEEAPSVVILDLMLPGCDGLDICRQLRAARSTVPIMILTARDDDLDQVLGLELGADDYMAKPAQPRVLLARLRALTRRLQHRPEQASPGQVLDFGRLRIDADNREVLLQGKRVELSPAEFDLLWLLASNAGKVMTRDVVLKSLRGLSHSSVDRSIDSRLYRLRRRFASEKEIFWRIKSVRPHGYLFASGPW